MRKLSLLLLVLLLGACAELPPSGEFTADCTYVTNLTTRQVTLICQESGTVQPTHTLIPATPTATNTPRPTATASPTVTPTTTAVPSADNRFINPSFEGNGVIYIWPSGLRLPEVATVANWKPFFRDFPYLSGPDPAYFQGTKNANGLMMGRPEMRSTTVPDRVRSGTGAQYWFCQFRACAGGVYQTILTTPGQTCSVSVYVQSWSRREWEPSLRPDTLNFLSQFPNGDAYSNSLWRVVVDPFGGSFFDAARNQRSQWYALPKTIVTLDGQSIGVLDHYDEYAQLLYVFTAQSGSATVFFENLRLFPFTFNDSMVDDASVVCQ